MLITAGSVAYLTVLPSTNTPSPNSSPDNPLIGNAQSNQTEVRNPTTNFTEPKREPANLAEVKNPIANITEPKKAGQESDPAGPGRESIVYVRSIYEHPYLVRPLGGVAFSATPFNSTGDIVVNLPGGAGVTLKQCIHRVPSEAAIVDEGRAVVLPNGSKVNFQPCPQGKTYTTNSTGWASIYPVANAKYYLLIRQTITEGTYAIAPVHPNQTTYATIIVPRPGPYHGILDNGGLSYTDGVSPAKGFSPSLAKGFISAEPLVWPVFHPTVLKGTSANLTITLSPTQDCLQHEDVCSDSDFPLRVDLSSHSYGIRPLIHSYNIENSKVRAVWQKEALPRNDPRYNLTNASITISQDPVVLGRNDRVNVTVTITAKSDASYGLYWVGLRAMVYSGAGNSSDRAFRWTMPQDIQFYLTINPFPVIVGKNYYFDKQGSSLLVPFVRNSTLLKDSTWFRLNYDGTFDIGSDSGSKRVGWWEIINNELFFTLPNMTFRGRVIENAGSPIGSSIILDDGSVWNIRKDG